MPVFRQRNDNARSSGLHLLIWLLATLLLVLDGQFALRWVGAVPTRSMVDEPVWQLAVVVGFLLLALALLASWTVLASRRHSAAQRQTLEDLQAITRRAPGVLYQYLLHPNGSSCFPFVSEVIRDIYRLSPEALAQDASPAFALIHPDDLAGVKAAIEASARTMTHCGIEFRMRGEDGTMCWHSSQAMPQRLANGAVLWHGFIANVTAHKQAEASLITLSAAIEQSPVSIIISDAKGNIQYVNPMFEQVTGYTRIEILGKPLKFLFSGEKSETGYRDIWQTLQEGKVWTGEVLNRCKAGALFWAQTTISPIFDERGVPIHYLAIKQNITDHKQAEAQLRIAAIAFESEEGMFITDAAGIILRVNPAFSRVTGYGAEEVIGKKPNLLKSGRHNAAFYTAMQAALDQNGWWQGEIWNRRKSGEIYPEWLNIRAVRDEQHTLTHYVATLTDISQRKADEAQIESVAFYDPLTGLPNRRFLCDRLNLMLAGIRRSHRSGALLLLDLDHFRLLNDTHDYEQGDLLLKQVAERLNDGVREGDTVARLDCDRFVVMLQDLSSNLTEAAIRADAVSEKILRVLRQPYHFSLSTHSISASLGVTLFNESSESADELLRLAELALCQAKEAGRNTLRFSDPDIQTAMNARAVLEAGRCQGLQNVP